MVAASIQKMQVGTVVVGKPIPFDVYDAEGRLLLNRGYVISTQDQLDRLYERGLFVSQNDVVAPVEVAGRKTAVFAEVPSLIEDIETTVNRVLSGESDSHRRLMGVGRRIIQLSQDDPDACLALAHSHTPQKNICRQPLIHSLFVAMVGQQLQWSNERLESSVKAAVIANLAYLSLQEKLNSSQTRLTHAQRAVLRKHPELAVESAVKAGIDDQHCLDIIHLHHESHDGSGYPRGLKEVEIREEAKILNLAERYTAMISRRAYRERLSPEQARQVLAHEYQDERLQEALASVLTPFPPGVFVRLANEEVAVVTHRTQQPDAPRVRAIISAKGSPYHGAFLRDCRLPEFRILYVENLRKPPLLNHVMLWGGS